MEQLNLPTHGRIYVDSPVIIYSVKHVEPYTTLLDPLWLHVETGRCSVVCSELVVLETLVKPMREGNSALVMQFSSVLDASDISLIPATRPLWEESARLRTLTGLKTPDALHAATALSEGYVLFITNDSDFRRVANLPVVVLDDLIKAEYRA